MQLSSLQMQLAQQGTAALQLQQQQLAGYLPLLTTQPPASSIESGSVPIQLDAVESLRQQPLCHQLFELQLQQQQQQGGWQVPSYCVYLHDQDAAPAEAAAAACCVGQQQQQQQQHVVMDDAAESLLKLLPER
jgi:hypothetical protein